MILITGATGKTGSATAKSLGEKGETFRALIRNEEKKEGLESLGGEVVIGSIENTEVVNQSMKVLKQCWFCFQTLRVNWLWRNSL